MNKNFKQGILIITLAILFLSNVALAEMQGNPTKGESLYKGCVPCHADTGKGIAGLPQDALVEIMLEYQEETYTNRKQVKMQQVLKPMTKQELMDLAAYISTL